MKGFNILPIATAMLFAASAPAVAQTTGISTPGVGLGGSGLSAVPGGPIGTPGTGIFGSPTIPSAVPPGSTASPTTGLGTVSPSGVPTLGSTSSGFATTGSTLLNPNPIALGQTLGRPLPPPSLTTPAGSD